MNAEISETIGARLLRFGVQIPELLTQRKRMNAEISETMGARLLRFGVQIPKLPTQRKFKPPKTVAPTVLMLE